MPEEIEVEYTDGTKAILSYPTEDEITAERKVIEYLMENLFLPIELEESE